MASSTNLGRSTEAWAQEESVSLATFTPIATSIEQVSPMEHAAVLETPVHYDDSPTHSATPEEVAPSVEMGKTIAAPPLGRTTAVVEPQMPELGSPSLSLSVADKAPIPCVSTEAIRFPRGSRVITVDTSAVLSWDWHLSSPRAAYPAEGFNPAIAATHEFRRLRFRHQTREAEVRKNIARMQKRVKWDQATKAIFTETLQTPGYTREATLDDFVRYSRSASAPCHHAKDTRLFWLGASGTPYIPPTTDHKTKQLVVPRGACVPDWLVGMELHRKKALERLNSERKTVLKQIERQRSIRRLPSSRLCPKRGDVVLPTETDYDLLNQQLKLEAEEKFKKQLKSVQLKKTGRIEKLLQQEKEPNRA